MTWWNL